ncbi:MAG TPA: APC family permease [Pseudomonadota bacterium]|jgi:amino acid transporter|nr:APC family permease [Pseudomonadota bacterium]
MKHGSSVAKLATTRRSVRSRRAVRPRAQSLDPRTEKKFGGGADLPSLRRKLGLRALIATTFFVVSGGPYGLEEIIAGHGFGGALLLLLLVPFIWSLPITLMVGELTAALPSEGGYYAWARRALGPFWGVQTAWMALSMSLFDMAIYPMLVVTYLGQLFPALTNTALGGMGWYAALSMIVLSVVWNLRGTRTVGFTSQLMGATLLLPFVVLVAIACSGHGPTSLGAGIRQNLHVSTHQDGSMMPWLSGILLCMWNYMGWENASPVATEVESPQRTYPRAMFWTVLLVAGCYVVPVLCGVVSGLPQNEWTTGSWVEVGRRIGGPYLAVAIALGGALCGLGMFNALIASYSRLPLAMARDGILPKWLGRKDPRTGAPTRSILLAAVLYTACLGLGFKRLVQIDVMLYGALVLTEFVSLIVLRRKEPQLVRPFRIPGGPLVLALIGMLPVGLLGLSLWIGRHEEGMWGLPAVAIGALVIALGPLFYLASRLLWGKPQPTSEPSQPTPSSSPDEPSTSAVETSAIYGV